MRPCDTARTELSSDMDGATVDTRRGSAEDSCPMGSADDGARGPLPILKMLTCPNGTVFELGARSPRGP